MSYSFLKEVDILSQKQQVGPETFKEFAIKLIEKIVKEPEYKHLIGQAFFEFNMILDDLNQFLIVKPELLDDLQEKILYINAYKAYLQLSQENCIRTIEKKNCCFRYNFFQLRKSEVPLNIYLQINKVNQFFLLRLGLLLIKSISKCHKKAYFIEFINQKTVFIDILNQNVLLINPIQKLLLQFQNSFNNKNSQANSPKNDIKGQLETLKVKDLIKKDSLSFIQTFLSVIGIRNSEFKDMIGECNLFQPFLQRNFKGRISNPMQYLIIYLQTLQNNSSEIDLTKIEIMIMNILYQDIRSTQKKYLKQCILNQTQKENKQISNKNLESNSNSKIKVAQKLDVFNIKESKSMKNIKQPSLLTLNSPKQYNSLQINLQYQQIQKKCQTDLEQNLNTPRQKVEKVKRQFSSIQIHNQTSPKQILNKQSLTSSTQNLNNEQKYFKQKSIDDKQKSDEKIKHKQAEAKEQQKNGYQEKQNQNIEQNPDVGLSSTFKESQLSECVKDQINWLNGFQNKQMTQNQAYFQLKKLDKIKEKSIEQWQMTAWMQYKYFGFFQEPLQIMLRQVKKLEQNSSSSSSNCQQNQKMPNQSDQNGSSILDKSQSYSLIGILYWKWKKYQKAVQAFKTALKFDSRNQYALYYLGKFNIVITQNYEEGNRYLDQLLQVNPYNGQLIRKIVNFNQYCPDKNELFWYYLSIIANPKCSKSLLNIAKKYYVMRNHKLALFFCAKGIDLDKNEKEFYLVIGMIFNVERRLEKSLKYLIKAESPKNKQIPGLLCDLHRYYGDLEETEINFYKDLKGINILKTSPTNFTNFLYG